MIQRYFLVRVACCACNMFWWEISLCDDEESKFGCAEAKGEENRSLAEMVNAFNFSPLVYCGDTLKRMRSCCMILDFMSGLLYQIQETCLMFTPQFKYGALLSPRQVGDELYISRRSQHTSDSLSCFRFHSFPADVKPNGLVRLLKYDKKPASHRSSQLSCL